MVAHTAHGWASMQDSDKLGDVGAVTLELATLLESRVKLPDAGVASVAVPSLDTTVEHTVTFAVPYAAAPVVTGLNKVTTLPHQVHLSISSISATQLKINVRRSTGTVTPVVVHWSVRG